MPVFSFTEVETENEKMRFLATLSLNKFEVGKGYGANKKFAKMSSARMALISLVPQVYAEWQQSSGRINALYKQNRNGHDVVAQEQAELTLVKDAFISPRATSTTSSIEDKH